MSCSHRFIKILIPTKEDIEFLFIGTFNPEWNAANGNDANFFYGRATSLFWCICPHAFNEKCLIDKGKDEWIEFINSKKISLTDIIRCVTNANPGFENHQDLLTKGFEDKNLDLKDVSKNYIFNLEFNTPHIKSVINKNKDSLKGVFFTRSTFNDIPRIREQWEEIKIYCKVNSIYTTPLPTPSTRGGTIRDKIFTWREEVNECYKAS